MIISEKLCDTFRCKITFTDRVGLPPCDQLNSSYVSHHQASQVSHEANSLVDTGCVLPVKLVVLFTYNKTNSEEMAIVNPNYVNHFST